MNFKEKIFCVGKNISKIIGTVIGSILLLLCLIFEFSFTTFIYRNEIISNIINFITISTGFLMTTLSILASTSNSRIMKHLAKNKKIKQLNMFFVEPITVSILLIILCIIEMTFEENTKIEHFISSTIIALSMNFIVDFIKIGYLSIKILQKIMEENFDTRKIEKPIQPNIENAFFSK